MASLKFLKVVNSRLRHPDGQEDIYQDMEIIEEDMDMLAMDIHMLDMITQAILLA